MKNLKVAVWVISACILPISNAGPAGREACASALVSTLHSQLSNSGSSLQKLRAEQVLEDIAFRFDRRELERAARRFLRSQRLIYRSENPDLEGVVEFYSSNEYDWYQTPWDTAPADVILGFGTNSAWDLAVRKNAKALVLGDISLNVLMAQHLVFRPLILLAQSRLEFLGLLAGVPVKDEAGASLERMFEIVESARSTVTSGERTRFIRETLRALARSSFISADAAYFVRGYYAAVLNLEVVDSPDFRSRARQGGVPASAAGPFKDTAHGWRIGDAYSMFEDRYRPRRLEESGARGELLSERYFSFLSSDEGYKRLRSLFRDDVY